MSCTSGMRKAGSRARMSAVDGCPARHSVLLQILGCRQPIIRLANFLEYVKHTYSNRGAVQHKEGELLRASVAAHQTQLFTSSIIDFHTAQSRVMSPRHDGSIYYKSHQMAQHVPGPICLCIPRTPKTCPKPASSSSDQQPGFWPSPRPALWQPSSLLFPSWHR
jgi:hypothetical protein